MKNLYVAVLAVVLVTACKPTPPPPVAPPVKPVATEAELQKMLGRFAPTPMAVDISRLSPGDREALRKLIEASRLIDTLYMKQLWEGNAALYEKLRADETPLGKLRTHYFWLNKGPWSDLDGFKAFLPEVPDVKPLGAAFYPTDMTAAAFDTWAATLSKEDAASARGFYTVVRRESTGLKIVPYSKAYTSELTQLALLLREAGQATDNDTLRHFLSARADSLLSDDYYASEVAWMDLDAPLDITIGPYETYTDELFGYKAAFEAYVNLRDDAETAKLAFFGKHLQELENNLPEDPQYRNAKLGAAAPLRVVNEIFAAGDGAHGVMTAAYNLPNDDKVVAEKGSKRVMLKNVQEAKFEKTLQPIAARVLTSDAQKNLSFDWFFTHVVAHELMHGLGPHQIKVAGRETNPRLELKNSFGAIEEAKADVTGLWALQYLIDHAARLKLKNVMSLNANSEKQLYTTYLASMFRTLRFGLSDSHGKGMAMQINYLMDHGAVSTTADGRFVMDYAKVKTAIRDLDRALLTVEAQGDLAGANKMLEQAVIRPEVQKALDGLADLPTDIEPIYETAEQLEPAK